MLHPASHCNLAYREEEREMIPLCLDLGVGLIPWSPPRGAGWPGCRILLRPTRSGPVPTRSPRANGRANETDRDHRDRRDACGLVDDQTVCDQDR